MSNVEASEKVSSLSEEARVLLLILDECHVFTPEEAKEIAGEFMERSSEILYDGPSPLTTDRKISSAWNELLTNNILTEHRNYDELIFSVDKEYKFEAFETIFEEPARSMEARSASENIRRIYEDKCSEYINNDG